MIPVPVQINGGIGSIIGYAILLIVPLILGVFKHLQAYSDLKRGKLSKEDKNFIWRNDGKVTPLELMDNRLLYKFDVISFLISMSYSISGLIAAIVLIGFILVYFIVST